MLSLLTIRCWIARITSEPLAVPCLTGQGKRDAPFAHRAQSQIRISRQIPGIVATIHHPIAARFMAFLLGPS